MNTEMLVPAVAMGCSAVVGGWVGYQLRKLVVWSRERRRNGYAAAKDHSFIREPAFIPSKKSQPAVVPAAMPVFIPAAKRQQAIPVIAESTSDRDDVVAALVGLGFKKGEANAAVDACTLAERASGVEPWVAAALRSAVR